MKEQWRELCDCQEGRRWRRNLIAKKLYDKIHKINEPRNIIKKKKKL